MSQQGLLSGVGVTGTVVQIVETSTTAYLNTNAIIPKDATIPQITEGTQFLSLAITPTSATNKLLFQFSCFATVDNLSSIAFALFEDAGPNAIYATISGAAALDIAYNSNFTFIKTAGSTSTLTYTLRFGTQAGDVCYINGLRAAVGPLYTGVSRAQFVIMEY